MAMVDYFLLGYLLLTVGALLALWHAGIGTGSRPTIATTTGDERSAALTACGPDHGSAGIAVLATLEGPVTRYARSE